MLRTSFLILALVAAPAQADVPRVVTDIPALHSLVQQVMGTLGQPQVLLEQGANPHSYQLRPRDARALQDADLVVWVGPELTPWLDRVLHNSPDSARITLLEDQATGLRHLDDQPDHDTSHGHAHHGVDPHAWLDPDNGITWTRAIASELSRLDPGNADIYAANAEAAAERITTAKDDITVQLAAVQNRPFLVFHDAYGYFSDHFGLTVAAALAESDAQMPGAGELRELRELSTSGQIVCAFPDAQHDAQLIQTVTEDSLVRIGDPLDASGSTLPLGPDLYETLLRDMADTIADCLSQG